MGFQKGQSLCVRWMKWLCWFHNFVNMIRIHMSKGIATCSLLLERYTPCIPEECFILTNGSQAEVRKPQITLKMKTWKSALQRIPSCVTHDNVSNTKLSMFVHTSCSHQKKKTLPLLMEVVIINASASAIDFISILHLYVQGMFWVCDHRMFPHLSMKSLTKVCVFSSLFPIWSIIQWNLESLLVYPNAYTPNESVTRPLRSCVQGESLRIALSHHACFRVSHHKKTSMEVSYSTATLR